MILSNGGSESGQAEELAQALAPSEEAPQEQWAEERVHQNLSHQEGGPQDQGGPQEQGDSQVQGGQEQAFQELNLPAHDHQPLAAQEPDNQAQDNQAGDNQDRGQQDHNQTFQGPQVQADQAQADQSQVTLAQLEPAIGHQNQQSAEPNFSSDSLAAENHFFALDCQNNSAQQFDRAAESVPLGYCEPSQASTEPGQKIEPTATGFEPSTELRAPRPNFLTATRFTDFDLPPEIMSGIDAAGFDCCTPIQAQVIPVALAGDDIAGQAQTGTGKTTAFLVPVLTRLLRHQPVTPGLPRALVITPTRELAVQIHQDAKVLAGATKLSLALVVGGMEYREQAEVLETGVDLVICTPGRLLDYLFKGIFIPTAIEVAVVDEADRLLDMGFIKDLKSILSHLPSYTSRQTMLFSATLDDRVLELTYQYMNPPQYITAEPDPLSKIQINQSLYHISHKEKLSLLLGLLAKEEHSRVIIFCNTKSGVEWLTKKLVNNGFQAEGITGDLPQPKRLKLMDAFKEKQLQIMVATDVASRGIHVEDVSHVYNFDLPQDAENYIHRIGRTARAGKSGRAVSFACEEHVFHLEAIENILGEKIPVVWPDDDLFAADHGGEVKLRSSERDRRPLPRDRKISGGPAHSGTAEPPRIGERRGISRVQRPGGIFGLSPRYPVQEGAADPRQELSWRPSDIAVKTESIESTRSGKPPRLPKPARPLNDADGILVKESAAAGDFPVSSAPGQSLEDRSGERSEGRRRKRRRGKGPKDNDAAQAAQALGAPLGLGEAQTGLETDELAQPIETEVLKTTEIVGLSAGGEPLLPGTVSEPIVSSEIPPEPGAYFGSAWPVPEVSEQTETVSGPSLESQSHDGPALGKNLPVSLDLNSMFQIKRDLRPKSPEADEPTPTSEVLERPELPGAPDDQLPSAKLSGQADPFQQSDIEETDIGQQPVSSVSAGTALSEGDKAQAAIGPAFDQDRSDVSLGSGAAAFESDGEVSIDQGYEPTINAEKIDLPPAQPAAASKDRLHAGDSGSDLPKLLPEAVTETLTGASGLGAGEVVIEAGNSENKVAKPAAKGRIGRKPGRKPAQPPASDEAAAEETEKLKADQPIKPQPPEDEAKPKAQPGRKPKAAAKTADTSEGQPALAGQKKVATAAKPIKPKAVPKLGPKSGPKAAADSAVQAAEKSGPKPKAAPKAVKAEKVSPPAPPKKTGRAPKVPKPSGKPEL
ncbi:MAG: DEAD/DEAH box helicase [Deltaproteobacteria bacterium]|jgi:ATP-dependent RNA helicase RhlB|nr:DEAD/DEAH box helicase [Deltaproteobacteria bacterium]